MGLAKDFPEPTQDIRRLIRVTGIIPLPKKPNGLITGYFSGIMATKSISNGKKISIPDILLGSKTKKAIFP
jgi:hypothetical protein